MFFFQVNLCFVFRDKIFSLSFRKIESNDLTIANLLYNADPRQSGNVTRRGSHPTIWTEIEMETEMKTEFEISPEIQEILDDLPPVVIKRGERTHPMFSQWSKMIEACSNPKDRAFPKFGGRGITVMHRWYTFSNFVEDMQAGFENEPSKPPMLRKNYLARRNLKAGFNLKNAYWAPRSEAVQVQSKTLFVDTPFGKQMTLRELEQYLKDHAGEPLPPTVKPPTYMVRQFNTEKEKWEPMPLTLDEIQPISLFELRRRQRLGKCLITPARPYGTKNERIREDSYEPPPPSIFKQPVQAPNVLEALSKMGGPT